MRVRSEHARAMMLAHRTMKLKQLEASYPQLRHIPRYMRAQRLEWRDLAHGQERRAKALYALGYTRTARGAFRPPDSFPVPAFETSRWADLILEMERIEEAPIRPSSPGSRPPREEAPGPLHEPKRKPR